MPNEPTVGDSGNSNIEKVAKHKSGRKLVYCSFCRKSNDEVRKIVAGPGVWICNECVRLSADVCGYSISEKE